MERKVALKKLAQILGPKFGYQVDPKAPDRDGREEARAKRLETRTKREALEKALNERRRALLEADAEYQRLKVEYTAASDRNNVSFPLNYRFTAGTSNGMFFHVKAQGDSWEEVIDKLTAKQ